MRQVLLCLLTVATAASLLSGTAVGAQDTRVFLVPTSSTLPPGAVVVVEVQVQDVLDLYAVDLQMAFDPAVVEVLDADGQTENGVQIARGSFLSSVYMFTGVNRADNETGEIRYLVSLLSPAPAVSGSGVLASITFRARNPGSTVLRLSVLLANSRAEYIPAVITDGLIVVTGDTATPTATPIATSTPSRTATGTATRTATPGATLTPARTPTGTFTPTPVASATRTGTPPVPDHFVWLPLLLRAHSVPTLTPLPSLTPTPTATVLATLTPSATAPAEATPSPSATAGVTPWATVTPTASALPSSTATVTPTPAFTASPSPTGDATPAATRSPTPTPTATMVASPTPSLTPTGAPTPSLTPESRQLLLNPSFEEDAAWAQEGGVPPVYTMARAHSGVRSMRLGIILPSSGAVYSSIRQEVTLPSQITAARLSLYYFPVGWPQDRDDIYLYITRASDGTVLFVQRWMQWDQAWYSHTVNLLSQLQPYAGQQVRVRIGVYNDGDGMTAVYLDDVELWVVGDGRY